MLPEYLQQDLQGAHMFLQTTNEGWYIFFGVYDKPLKRACCYI